jgi:hypothetical protein
MICGAAYATLQEIAAVSLSISCILCRATIYWWRSGWWIDGAGVIYCSSNFIALYVYSLLFCRPSPRVHNYVCVSNYLVATGNIIRVLFVYIFVATNYIGSNSSRTCRGHCCCIYVPPVKQVLLVVLLFRGGWIFALELPVYSSILIGDLWIINIDRRIIRPSSDNKSAK